jgi:hypothetical protein
MSLMTLVGANLGSGAAIAFLNRPAQIALKALRARRNGNE